MRRHPRFITDEQIILEVDGRNELREVWMRDISKGGLFVATPAPPPFGSRLKISIQTPEGGITLRGEVVHVLEGEQGGAGIQLLDLTPERRQGIEAYVEGLAGALEDAALSADLTDDESAQVQEVMTRFLHRFEAEDLYGALGVEPDTPFEELDAQLDELRRMFGIRPSKLPPALGARLSHARVVLDRVCTLMRDPKRRRDFDFRHDYVFAERRITAARTPARVAKLREEWHSVHRERVAKSHRAGAEAIRAVNKLDYEGAVTAGEAALADDPFNLELREAVREWRHRIAQRQGSPPRMRRKSA